MYINNQFKLLMLVHEFGHQLIEFLKRFRTPTYVQRQCFIAMSTSTFIYVSHQRVRNTFRKKIRFSTQFGHLNVSFHSFYII